MPVKLVALVTMPWQETRISRRTCVLINKLIGLFLVLVMAVQLLHPLGYPGLKRRRDFWKLALLAFALWSVVLVIRP